MTHIEIQKDAIARYNVTISDGANCWRRMHAHVKTRTVCKWHPKASARATFELLHEIGHIETTTPKMRRCEAEYYATVWALERCKEYGVKVPQQLVEAYQEYIDMEYDRGIRRGGSGYPKNLRLPV